MSDQTASPHSLPNRFRAAIIGSSGAIGGACAQILSADTRCAEVLRFCRSPHNNETPLDLRDAASIEAAAQNVGEIHLLIIATGALIIDGHRPEKALAQLNQRQLLEQLALNAVGPAMVLRSFAPKLPKRQRAVIGVLSARVGSIEDNKLGGWHGYRAAKAALNQYIRTASVELSRTRPNAVIAALHPGTVESTLSKPFRPGGAAHEGVFTPAQSASKLLRVLDALSPEQTGGFWDYDGRSIPW